ncbi:CRINKLY4 related 3 [Perilla frutescens var. hirtella]|uniref:non-specific serine/threonine protein kinase n=1 Tax=Perilla frutescens var. hirtella TaxID=608512 RepID=A0AAD4J517_PERFH|nr:CRINKLY4 related 3 [Perilla frutescens var. hirtella]
MTTLFPAVISAVLLFLGAVCPPPPSAHALGGSAATVAVVYGSATTICTISAQPPVQQIQCWRNGLLLPPLLPNTSFDAVAGGRDTLCGVRSGGFSLLCWNTTFSPKRIYSNASAPLTSLTVGGTQICALKNVTSGNNVICWRQNNSPSPQIPNGNSQFRMISSGLRFSCGVTRIGNRVLCWGDDVISNSIQTELENSSMLNIQVGERFACGIDVTGFIICKGSNDSGQLNIPSETAQDYSAVALGASHGCAIRKANGTVVCWGGNGNGNRNGEISSKITDDISFESIVAGPDFSCGLTTSNFSIICWGPGWPNEYYATGILLPLQKTLPGPCVETVCECNVYPGSEIWCSGNGHICRHCDIPSSIPPTLQPTVVTSSPSRGLRRGLLAFAIVGSVGGVAGIATVIYCLWSGICLGKKKIHNSVQPTISAPTAAAPPSNGSPLSRSSTLRRQGSRLMRRQRSGTSSKHADTAEELLFSDLVLATNDFSLENKIGAGSFGVVYKGKLADGREVAIKRSETGAKAKAKLFQEKESAFDSELAFLSRLHHKHLVRLVGFCEERDERLLVYEYMKNGALYDHLHSKSNVEKSSSVVNSWKMRIKISLDAARGIEYLHNYAVPPIIHRDIKSSNILLDSNWTARVSDFGLSLMGPEHDSDYRPAKAAGTVGYIDPEYYGLNVLTAKSDVYGLGIVLLELVTGKRAIFKNGENGGEPMSVVDYAVPAIMAGEVAMILDPRVGPPEASEAEAMELVAYTAMHCVHLEGKDRPTINDIVANLERALALCDDSHGSISSGPISILSD